MKKKPEGPRVLNLGWPIARITGSGDGIKLDIMCPSEDPSEIVPTYCPAQSVTIRGSYNLIDLARLISAYIKADKKANPKSY